MKKLKNINLKLANYNRIFHRRIAKENNQKKELEDVQRNINQLKEIINNKN